MRDEDLARENDDRVHAETRAKILALMPDEVLLNLFEQSVIDRAVRAVSDIASNRPAQPCGPLIGLFALLAVGFGVSSVQAQTAPAPIVTAVISSQGTEVIKQTTGYSPKTATLARIDICNADPQNDHNQSVSGAIAAIVLQEQYSIYGSDVVNAVLAQLQSRDVFTRAQKAIAAGSNTATLITALFKTLTPLTVSVIQAAPAIAQAVLPAVGDPRDLASLGQKILQDNSSLTLGKRGSGNDCKTGLAVVMATSVKIDKVVVQ